ncbi:hypothetical protein [Caldicellulosiruptor changbaiensis]|uniref:hypothetical protein n=1 Tax=Caldicellulosiruptor changbaiensis TaxID=1222016 RepID=UPI0019D2C963|nr:hypothetical protein [Caldicellulosiruptor changbaiensis]
MSELTITIGSYLRRSKKLCEIYTALFDVVLVERRTGGMQAINAMQSLIYQSIATKENSLKKAALDFLTGIL